MNDMACTLLLILSMGLLYASNRLSMRMLRDDLERYADSVKNFEKLLHLNTIIGAEIRKGGVRSIDVVIRRNDNPHCGDCPDCDGD